MTDQPLPVYIAGKRYGLSLLQLTNNGKRDFLFADQEKINLLWILSRSIAITQTVPGWTDFRISITSKQTINKTSMRYLYCINAPARDISIVYNILERCLKIKEALKLETVVCVFDQAIYCKVMEIKWKNSERYSFCLVMLGIFHAIMMFSGVMGMRFADFGLKDYLIQSGIVAESSIDKSLCEKQHNRSVRSVKLVYKAFWRILLEMLHEQYESKYELLLYDLKDKMKDFYSNINQEQFETLIENSIFTNYSDLVIDFTCNLKENGGDLARF